MSEFFAWELSAMLFIVTERDWVWRVFSVVMMGLLWFLGKGKHESALLLCVHKSNNADSAISLLFKNARAQINF
jgi:hypothetical protein